LVVFALALGGLLPMPSMFTGASASAPAGHHALLAKASAPSEFSAAHAHQLGVSCCAGAGEACAFHCALSLPHQLSHAPLLELRDGGPAVGNVPALAGRTSRPPLRPPRA
jgi:hypothetical protein